MHGKSASPNPTRLRRLADRLHSAAIHLLRQVRTTDEVSGLSAPHLSALSVVVFAGPHGIGELATVEQVTPASISRTVDHLQAARLVVRDRDPADRRRRLVRATPLGRRVLDDARQRRLDTIVSRLEDLPPLDLEILARAADLIERVATRPPASPPAPPAGARSARACEES